MFSGNTVAAISVRRRLTPVVRVNGSSNAFSGWLPWYERWQFGDERADEPKLPNSKLVTQTT